MPPKRANPKGPFAEWFDRVLRQADWTFADVARELGLVHQTVRKWWTGETVPEPENIKRLADMFGVGELYLARLAGRIVGDVDRKDFTFEEAARMIRLKAPIPIRVEGIASAGPGAHQDTVWRNSTDRGRHLRAVEITGDCLAPRIEPGDVVIVDLDARWDMGNVVVAKHDGHLVAKRYFGDELRGMDGQSIPASECEIIGVAVEVNKRLI